MKLVSTVIAVLLVGFLSIWFGLFNVSAKDKHWGVTTKLLEVIKDKSVGARAGGTTVPDLSSPTMVSNGAKNYDAMCAQCHLSPVKTSSELNIGLYPTPPIFYKNAHGSHNPESAFWVIKNGIKLTGMPAWGDLHTDEQMWEMVAFLQKVGGMSESEYKTLVGEGGHAHKEGMGDHRSTATTTNKETAAPEHDMSTAHHQTEKTKPAPNMSVQKNNKPAHNMSAPHHKKSNDAKTSKKEHDNSTHPH